MLCNIIKFIASKDLALGNKRHFLVNISNNTDKKKGYNSFNSPELKCN